MKIEDFKAEMSKIKALSDSPEMIEILTGLEADYQNVLNEHNKAIEERDSAIAEKQKYADINTKLWIASHSQEDNSFGSEDTNKLEDEPPKKRSYSDLDLKGDDI